MIIPSLHFSIIVYFTIQLVTVTTVVVRRRCVIRLMANVCVLRASRGSDVSNVRKATTNTHIAQVWHPEGLTYGICRALGHILKIIYEFVMLIESETL